MKLLLAATVGVALLLSITSAAEVPRGTAGDRDAVALLVAEFDRCARAKDVDGFLSHSLDDVVALGPGEPAVVGKPAVRAWYERFYATFDVDMVHRPVETASFGDVVVTRGEVTGRIRPVAGGAAIDVNNKYLFVLKRQADGSLKVWRAMFNANGTAPQAGK